MGDDMNREDLDTLASVKLNTKGIKHALQQKVLHAGANITAFNAKAAMKV